MFDVTSRELSDLITVMPSFHSYIAVFVRETGLVLGLVRR